MIQSNWIQLTSQTPNHVEITKMLSTSQPERRKYVEKYIKKYVKN